ncbi:hypothetical protein PHYBLDRAFT_167682 [Phycomyces blakesleeanus NRRL 1555(-)]|uniref:Uncharacterized protein n=1 Tax=Phycomyces blakesleeanus (strain ATCC 8743b / DSM 1359 / FGSC 10004 / NBRC 33097 / NRRL 1555) TaxID=763407 RepID=A0A163AL67_PHYB8|nr:hypothetical protein PHYBLDRAFT_167682 [Phycomyces blakesleeanus NRRL 1555(-)]OAD74261.1 hypothetical protein PHYBLDRAFT_167682 [Phycomyces blakesleeanus NRRL 1555(-)]|eukprot:XP_018292301.1 hypothetical protein PHYBLDRAFT_167682 [Phycomyces blakesleeanus NRRL 1555(-)]
MSWFSKKIRFLWLSPSIARKYRSLKAAVFSSSLSISGETIHPAIRYHACIVSSSRSSVLINASLAMTSIGLLVYFKRENKFLAIYLVHGRYFTNGKFWGFISYSCHDFGSVTEIETG